MLKPEFTDAKGRHWTLTVTLAHLKPLREAGLDVSRFGREEPAPIDDPERYARVLWTLVETQAAAAGVSPEEFASGLDGPALFAAVDGTLAALADFTNRPEVAREVKTRLAADLARLDAETVARVNGTAPPDPPAPRPEPSAA